MQNPFGNQNNNQDFLKNLPTPPNYAKVINDTGDIRIAKVGISWTTFWFGPLPALFRGDYYNFALILVTAANIALVGLVFNLPWLLGFPWSSLIFTLIYNRLYFQRLFDKGWRPADQASRELLIRNKYLKE